MLYEDVISENAGDVGRNIFSEIVHFQPTEEEFFVHNFFTVSWTKK